MSGAETCPRCGAPRVEGAAECRTCGVLFARVRARSPAVPAPPPAPAPGPRLSRPSPAQLEALLAGLATALDAGVPLTVHHPASGLLPAKLAARFVEDAKAGVPLGRTIAELRLLDQASSALVTAADERGDLPRTLRFLAERQADRRRDRNRLLIALAYPSFLLLAAGLLLPLPDLVRDGLGAYVRGAAPFVGAVLLAVAGAAFWVLRAPDPDAPALRAVRRIGRFVPLASGAARHGALARFADVLGSAYRAGVPVRHAVRLAIASSGHPSFEDAAAGIEARLDAGGTLTEALAAVSSLPPAYLAELEVGERSGKLDACLDRLAERHRGATRVATIAALGALTAIVVGITAALLVRGIVLGWKGVFRDIDQNIERVAPPD